jgi:tRNA A37 threonylcarbamoyladenosine synthetase subunit TsaC/SUA5/YrdC
VNLILNMASGADRRLAAAATANGAALFYGFGNFCALAALPDLDSMRRINTLKGRPLDQAGSVTTDPARAHLVFDWDQLPAALSRETVQALMDDFLALGPFGFRGPAATGVPEHLTVVDHGIRTVQLISPGHRCPSNELVRDILARTGEDLLFITSANTSSTVSKQAEAAHCEMRAIRDEFGHHPAAILIGHPDEHVARRMYPRHLPCSTSIVAFHHEGLALERHGSLGIDDVRAVADRHGLDLAIAPAAHTRLPVRWPGTAVRSYAA